MTTTDLRPAIICPAWCRRDHVLEQEESAQRAKEAGRYLRALENQAELRQAFGPDFTPPAGDLLDLEPDAPVHEQEVGRVYVEGRDGEMVPVRVLAAQLGQGEQAHVAVLPQGATYCDDSYSPQQARALAALLVVAAQVLGT